MNKYISRLIDIPCSQIYTAPPPPPPAKHEFHRYKTFLKSE